MEIKNFNLHLLTNHYHFQYATEFKQLTDGKETELKLTDAYAKFKTLYAQEDEALMKITKSKYTEEKQNADKDRDVLFSGLVSTVNGALNHFDPAVQAAAKRVKIVLNNYGNLAVLGIKEQTSATYNLIQELRKEPLATDTAAIGLTAWVDELEKRNKALEALEEKQYDEASQKTTLRMKEVRKEMDTVIRSIWKRLEALMLIEGEAPYAEYVRQLNERNTKYADIIAQRAGSRNAKKEEEVKEAE